MEKLKEFLTRFPDGDYSLDTFEEIENHYYPYFSVIDNKILLFINNYGIFIVIDPTRECDDGRVTAHISILDLKCNPLSIGDLHLNIEIGMELYLANSEKPIEQILRDIAISAKPYFEFIINTEFIVKSTKSAK